MLYTCDTKGGDYAKMLINKKIFKYLSSLKLTENTRLIITNLEETIYDNKDDLKETISKDLLKYLLLNNCKITKQLTKNKIINIFNKKDLNNNAVSQIILPIKNKQNSIIGSIILLNYCNTFDKASVNLIYTIKQNIEFYYNIGNEEIISEYESNPIYNSSYINNIISIIDESIDNLFIDKNYKHIEELSYFKIDSLKNKLNINDITLLNEILELLEEKREYYAIYAIALGMSYKK